MAIAIQEDRYGPVLERQRNSPTLKAIWRGVYGPDYPEEADPFGFVTRTELRYVADELRMEAGGRMVDLGCGRGGPALWVARQTGAFLVGVDILPQAATEAAHRRGTFGMADRAGFLTASSASVPLRSDSFDAAMSVDALWMMIDKATVFREIYRILRASARIVFTTWQPGYLDYRVLLRAAGFRDITSWSPPGWRSCQLAVYAEIIARRDLLRSELGAEATEILVSEARGAPAWLEQSERLIITATCGKADLAETAP